MSRGSRTILFFVMCVEVFLFHVMGLHGSVLELDLR